MLDQVWFPLYITLKISLASSLIVAILGTLISYILARREFVGKWLVDVLVTLPMILPPTVTGYMLVVLLGKNGILGKVLFDLTGIRLLFTWQAAVIAAFVVSLPLMVKTATAAIEAVDRELEYVAYTLGRNELETALFITLPLAKKGILAGIVLSFARAVGEFGATLMVAGNIPGRTNTMAISIYSAFQGGNSELANTLVIILVLMSLISMAVTTKLVNSWKI
ncbi:MAG: Molybdate/tungstate transport system permease protein WtpB [Methanomethylovorans sp. PtaU1.Bin093]|jgi:molybdate transport system permease protein|uniref:molybdate ABC transporter permease subunit n=1 Tax=Methanomethylovorans sp. PtaU1.Bin093 TaxID=1811679 RepID=UPI0009CB835C|nr:molybdate ABC transporter permease subunit [Methanomethylovorans sp. PtaU1.Bin093]OPY21807.1 MAG: Molybdate/tungstate transport system permease protein WtpB [Methanomethylovorans sp. PtaU1.Bin093]